MTQPLVTVIVPTHNRPEFLKKTIDSILNQSYSNLELIVVSNGNGDANKRVISEILDSRLSFLEQENSGGPASPRNNGISRATGKYIAFCDDDDLWLEDKLEKQVSALEMHPSFGLCYANMLRFDDDREWSLPHEQGSADLNSLLYVNTVPISSVMVRKCLVDKLGGFCEEEIVGTSEDYEFLLRYATQTKFLHINEYLIRYWSGGNRTSSMAGSFTQLINNLKYILGCYYKIRTCNGVSYIKLFSPAVYQIKLITKQLVYNWFSSICR